MADKRIIRLGIDRATGKMTATGEGITVGVGGSDRQRTETFRNELYNGEVFVVGLDGEETAYSDGCHLVYRADMVITDMSKAEYEVFTGKPGSGNDA